MATFTGLDGTTNFQVGGYDTFTGGANTTNTFTGDASAMFAGGMGGNNTFTGGANATNRFYGDAHLMFSGSTGGDDTFTGGANANNNFVGDGREMSGTGGKDTFTGGANATNRFHGDAVFMDGGTGGDDTLTGGAGTAAINILYGDAQFMVPSENGSRGGNDRLVSGTNATDYMWGDAQFMDASSRGGQDKFAFAPSNGTDVIYDFQKGVDYIELDGFYKSSLPVQAVGHLSTKAAAHTPTKLISVADLNIKTVDANNDGQLDSVIQFDANNSVTVSGVTDLTASDFLFYA